MGKGIVQTWLLLASLVIVAHKLRSAAAQETPDHTVMKVIEDEFGNKADADSNLSFVDYDKMAEYKTPSDVPLLDEGMLAFYKFARSIARSAFGSGYPYEMVLAFKSLDFMGVISAADGRFKFCVVLGILVFIVYLILALFLPPCLCCSSRCKRRRRPPPSTLKVTGYGVAIVVLIGIFGVVGVAGAIQTTIHLTSALKLFLDSLIYALRDIRTFIVFSADEVLFIFVKSDFTKLVFFQDLDNIGPLMGMHMQDILNHKSGLGEAVEELTQLGNISQDTNTRVAAVDQGLTSLSTEVNNLGTLMTSTVSNPACSASGASCPSAPTLSFNKPNLGSVKGTLSGMQQTNLTELIRNGISEVSTIPEKAERFSTAQVGELKGNLQTQLKAVDAFRNVITDVRDKVLTTVNFKGLEKSLHELSSTVLSLDGRRSVGVKVLLVVYILAMALMLVGVVIVVVVYRKERDSTAWGFECPNTCSTVNGGRIIYAGVTVFVLLGWLFMLIAFILFMVGVPLDSMFCAIIQDPHFQIVDELTETHNILGPHPDKTWLSTVLPIPTSTSTVGSVLRDCRDDMSLFKAVEMDKHPLANFSRLIDFIDKMNISELISSINIPVGATNLLSGGVTGFLSQLENVGNNIPFTQLRNISNSIDTIKTQANNFAQALPVASRGAFQTQSQQQIQRLEQLRDTIYSDVDVLENNLDDISTKVASATSKASNAEAAIPTLVSGALADAAADFQGRVTKVVLSFIREAEKNVFEDYGKCKPLYNVFNALLNTGVCGNMVNVVNGAWLALDWLHVFMLVAIFTAITLNRLIPIPSSPESLKSNPQPTELPPPQASDKWDPPHSEPGHSGIEEEEEEEEEEEDGNISRADDSDLDAAGRALARMESPVDRSRNV